MSEMSQIDLKQRDLEKRIERLEAQASRIEQQVELDGMRQDLLRGMVKDLIDICGQK